MSPPPAAVIEPSISEKTPIVINVVVLLLIIIAIASSAWWVSETFARVDDVKESLSLVKGDVKESVKGDVEKLQQTATFIQSNVSRLETSQAKLEDKIDENARSVETKLDNLTRILLQKREP